MNGKLRREDYDKMPPGQCLLMQQGMEAFDGNPPAYRIALLDKPAIVWDFHSLILGVQVMFSFMLTGADKPIRQCMQPRRCVLQPAMQEQAQFIRAGRRIRKIDEEGDNYG